MNADIYREVQEAYGLKSAQFYCLGGYEDNVFVSVEDDVVIKFLDASRHSLERLQQEVDWMQLMDRNGVRVPRSVLSKNDKAIERITGIEPCFYVTVTERIKATASKSFLKDSVLIERWGRTLGKMHAISKQHADWHSSYAPWDYDHCHRNFILTADQDVQSIWISYQDQLKALSKTKDTFGVVHHDLHHDNLLLQNNDLYVLDFGDLRNSWYVYDLAIAVHTALENNRFRQFEEEHSYKLRFTETFLRGYERETLLIEESRALLPFFLKYRLVYSYMYFQHTLTDAKKLEVAQILNDMKNRIVTGETIDS
ncbi:phosphotransferase enzyme family protein [Geomicrobium sp. JCM 19038]|uniref:phosphotransferase enzyme family protein n=1 Tax=Geomicrobium sp. JCM 19038 TaxID=1460635 RepID=UPI00045F4D94|nr:phosphotransferase [Geomicrobium sp. JCM 19038]GAK08194.1 protein kinase [Geomicrobium sp. JCM 19038]